jgi:hypothetical protein
MLQEISYYQIFGKPLIMYMGVLTLLSFSTAATIGYLTITGKKRFPFKYHKWIAYFALGLGLVHGTFGLLLYF